MSHKIFIVKNWGLIDYQTAWREQEALFESISAIKQTNQAHVSGPVQATPNYIIFCEHPSVYTLGTVGDKGHLLVEEAYLQQAGISFVYTNRGGSITYHGPGQLVVYLVVDLENFCRDVHAYLRVLEQAVILTLAEFGVVGETWRGLTGVWVGLGKICAIGVRLAKWITMHGLALNVSTDLSYFEHIIPCGLEGSQVTSMEVVLGYVPPLHLVVKRLAYNLQKFLEQWAMTSD